jgi:hypothetical protein
MSEIVVVLVLAIVAAVLAGVELARTRGQDLISWAVLLVALALVVRAL